MGLFQEFRQFAIKGSAVDIGVGVVLGAAFSGLIDSLVKDLLLPPVGLVFKKMNFENLYIVLGGGEYASLTEAREAGAATINYGLFLTSFIRFIIVLFVIFLVIRQVNRWKKPHQHPSEVMAKKECPYCCTSIPKQARICPNCSSSITDIPKNPTRNELRLRIK
ncbi:large conductance mechanosensitive channel [Natronobacillus azotifigens]|uniref:Large-conductance mechanosensitive channel n=1 Tax=Natronobacillus azotifigens TaxID=472978 RepID=A0A9J6RG10_9BACI|nr:large conductance mechanosensitive channel protein MscL [Natronobacillus azotifigens]MCZ0704544.1 large conductance mechanosensitive channel protein MscL [Natronobacillus azotifigens]